MDVNSSSTVDSTADIDLICSLSKILNTGLDRRAIVVIKELLQLGVQPESLVDVIESIQLSQR